ncbi:hypothetical protein SNR37_002660 [Agarivorans aestuarii]|uniref:Uncharacterized protein n=1 Tax=Agarivorans aestuarii TaxID=1563703 RepID=A0ABU7G1Q9_9ALTE|nr:hypothetical protein [Agarivorans aestuarii]MEE1673246.1 hypothetical protein [Agarivorans aestuarii]
MTKFKVFLLSLALSPSLAAESIEVTWAKLVKCYDAAMMATDYPKAIDCALNLNQIDPASSEALYYIVVSHTTAGLEIPRWVLDSPWPNGSPEDLNLYKKSQELMGEK